MPLKPPTHQQRLARSRQTSHGRVVGDREYREHRGDDPIQRKADRLRSSGRWKRLRLVKLKRSPLCENCERYDITEPANDVNHRVPVVDLVARGEREKVFDLGLLESLCRRCHNKVTAGERASRGAERDRDFSANPRANLIAKNAANRNAESESKDEAESATETDTDLEGVGGRPRSPHLEAPRAAPPASLNIPGFRGNRASGPVPPPAVTGQPGAAVARTAADVAVAPADPATGTRPLSPREVEAIATTLARTEGIALDDALWLVRSGVTGGYCHIASPGDVPTPAQLRGDHP